LVIGFSNPLSVFLLFPSLSPLFLSATDRPHSSDSTSLLSFHRRFHTRCCQEPLRSNRGLKELTGTHELNLSCFAPECIRQWCQWNYPGGASHIVCSLIRGKALQERFFNLQCVTESLVRGLDLTRPEWQKKRKRMASRAGQASGRVR